MGHAHKYGDRSDHEEDNAIASGHYFMWDSRHNIKQTSTLSGRGYRQILEIKPYFGFAKATQPSSPWRLYSPLWQGPSCS